MPSENNTMINAREVTIEAMAAGWTSSLRLCGADAEEGVSEYVDFLESNSSVQRYVIEGESVPSPSLGGRSYAVGIRHRTVPPHDIEKIDLQQGFAIADIRKSADMTRTLGELGIFTCADVLAMGSASIAELTAGLDTGKVFGRARLRKLGDMISRVTHIPLPEDRAGPIKQHRYYDDIRNAGLAVALPGERFQTYDQFRFKQNHHRQTVGSLVGASLDKLGQLSDCPVGILIDFAVNELMEKVVKPFNRTGKRARS